MENTKKFRTKIKITNILELLETLDLDSESVIELSLDLPETKNTLKTLTTMCEDWELEEDGREKPEKKEEGIATIQISNYVEGSVLIDAVRRVGIDNPNLTFDSPEFIDKTIEMYGVVGNSENTLERELLKMILEGYYEYGAGKDIKNWKQDIIEKLRSLWPEIKMYVSTVSVAKRMFGN